MKYLVVNGDDLGLSPGVNRGILEAYERGILTSASLIVNLPWSGDAVEGIKRAPGLSVGLHVNLAGDNPHTDLGAQLLTQYARFQELVGRPPAHIDSHHNDHELPELLPHFSTLGARCGAPLRGHSDIRSLTSFYGRWDDESHPEQIDVLGLTKLLENEVADGVTELACHPGYVDAELRSSYSLERELELTTLCDPRVPQILRDMEIELIGSSDAARMFTPDSRTKAGRTSARR